MTCHGGAVADALRELGSPFAIETHPAAAPVCPPWRPLDDLVREPTVLLHRVDEVGRALASVAGMAGHRDVPRSSASLAHLGLVARLIAPAFAAAVGTGHVLDLGLADTWWQPVAGRHAPLSIVDSSAWSPVSDHLARSITEAVIDGPVRELTTAVAALSLSSRVLWGNVASVVHSSASLLAVARPQWALSARQTAVELLSSEPLAAAGTIGVADRFRRHSCCLLYRAIPEAPGPVCADCVLRPEQSVVEERSLS